MKKFALTAIAVSLVLSMPALAIDEHHPEKTAGAKPGVAQSAAAPVQKMQDNLKKMQTQLDRVAKAKTPEERQQAMMEHMKTMHANMMTAKGMMADDGMACPMMKDGMMGKGGMGMMGGMGAAPDNNQPAVVPERMQQMEKRMDMMQMMMEQMMRRQESAAAPMPMK